MRWAGKDSPVPRSFTARSRVLSWLATIVLLTEMEEHCENYGHKPRSRKSGVFFRTGTGIFKSKSKMEEHCENYGHKPRSRKSGVFFRTGTGIFKSKSKE